MNAGSANVSIHGRLPREAGVSRSVLAAAARRFAARSAARSGLVFRDIAVVLQDDGDSAAAHVAVMGVEGATDVITQRLEPIPPEPPGVYGELYVNCDMAIACGRGRSGGWSAAKELLLYVAHGMDHLSGADDATPGERMRMRRRELSWIRDLRLQ
ncbi:MAG: rRNA maturation RNAse YbeY [Kiritimatiellae bacterium]|nr:rRNA maturation RNAse YbeY [Kiritimatiellia bacterium]